MNTITNILNPDLAKAVAELGHFDTLVVADCGLPLPSIGPKVIDLSVKRGMPTFGDVLQLIAGELAVTEMIVANEIKGNSVALDEVEKAAKIIGELARKRDDKKADPKILYKTHDELKALTHKPECKYIVRTGDKTPYANVILVADVAF